MDPQLFDAAYESSDERRQQAEAERLKKQMLYESNRNGGRGNQLGNTTSGGTRTTKSGIGTTWTEMVTENLIT